MAEFQLLTWHHWPQSLGRGEQNLLFSTSPRPSLPFFFTPSFGLQPPSKPVPQVLWMWMQCNLVSDHGNFLSQPSFHSLPHGPALWPGLCHWSTAQFSFSSKFSWFLTLSEPQGQSQLSQRSSLYFPFPLTSLCLSRVGSLGYRMGIWPVTQGHNSFPLPKYWMVLPVSYLGQNGYFISFFLLPSLLLSVSRHSSCIYFSLISSTGDGRVWIDFKIFQVPTSLDSTLNLILNLSVY